MAKGKEPANKGKPMPAAQLKRQTENRRVPPTGQDAHDERMAAAVRDAKYHDEKQR